MTEITVRICGDHWVDVEQTLEQIRTADPEQPLVLDLQGEGPNITRLGVVDAVVKSGRDPGTIYIRAWPNNLDPVPFHRVDQHQLSHFFWMSKRYQRDIPVTVDAKKFGMFCGRLTYARAAMVWDAWHLMPDQILFSVMKSRTQPPWLVPSKGINLESLEHWIDAVDRPQFQAWWAACPITSIDDHWVKDQYEPNHNTNRDLLAHYHRFDTEIVMETVTMGPAFFPTEKTVRPMVAAKPMLVYGPKDYLANLRTLGFRTWHTCWDESYDQLEGPARWRAIRDLMQQDLQADPAIAQHNLKNLAQVIETYQPR